MDLSVGIVLIFVTGMERTSLNVSSNIMYVGLGPRLCKEECGLSTGLHASIPSPALTVAITSCCRFLKP